MQMLGGVIVLAGDQVKSWTNDLYESSRSPHFPHETQERIISRYELEKGIALPLRYMLDEILLFHFKSAARRRLISPKSFRPINHLSIVLRLHPDLIFIDQYTVGQTMYVRGIYAKRRSEAIRPHLDGKNNNNKSLPVCGKVGKSLYMMRQYKPVEIIELIMIGSMLTNKYNIENALNCPIGSRNARSGCFSLSWSPLKIPSFGGMMRIFRALTSLSVSQYESLRFQQGNHKFQQHVFLADMDPDSPRDFSFYRPLIFANRRRGD